MPMYEYGCQTCGARFERRKHVSARAADTCDTCGGAAVLVPSVFAYNGIATHTEWSDVAPVDADGHLLSRGEAVKDGRFDKYNPMGQLRSAQKKSEQADQHRGVMWDEAKRETWHEQKVVIR